MYNYFNIDSAIGDLHIQPADVCVFPFIEEWAHVAVIAVWPQQIYCIEWNSCQYLPLQVAISWYDAITNISSIWESPHKYTARPTFWVLLLNWINHYILVFIIEAVNVYTIHELYTKFAYQLYKDPTYQL